MIEVEMRFQPTEEQLDSLLKEAVFVASVEIHDVYYDYPDFRLLKEGVRLRKRDGVFELKIKKDTSIHQEIENKQDIEKYFNVDISLEDFMEKN
ncbi:MAG: CYTH domain-containing protein, partial [bacterium]